LFDGANLTIEDCEIYGMSGRGIRAFASGAKITVRRSIVRDNAFRGISLSGALTATMDGRSRTEQSCRRRRRTGVEHDDQQQRHCRQHRCRRRRRGGHGADRCERDDEPDDREFGDPVERHRSRGNVGWWVDARHRYAQLDLAEWDGRLAALSAGGAVVVLSGSAVTHNGVAGADTSGGGAIQTLQNNVFQSPM
jgi:hypothetical protein